ncbi:MAG: photosystem II protein Psb27 [Cyanobacteria bacterium QH_8_48_120]|nr:MAG: photosystem II protein Psb27 [Cyanobacteria bacterium QH_1_48_107]PSO59244.1 MAG: photosystem II protein Psb27 [Cyanobacteria bacterium QH_2_48_84]PSO60555.1 MAG: photosystem II protein Psb27 [Cyanobacteria bacterium QH_10_48_56]PSO61858.1 MAG: photosystem II protein Psb27 [Cyanobacteria bacterium QH_7_48_89]PSO63329.1 MAG: photosystem II protein Psb27 [Cyanobacteria bacterium QH_6_48_35]PSO71206.1 MAG: photosystem II protein Psb27 [Cyanobacteria bacterium QS_1_48_34]PSO72534.1 MAG: p
MKSLITRLLALVLVVVVGLTGCSNPETGLSGDYRQDTLTVLDNLNTVIELPEDDPKKSQMQEKARKQINAYVARYRRDNSIAGLRSFTTMRTALNALGGYYNSSSNRPLPEDEKERLKQEFASVERSLELAR